MKEKVGLWERTELRAAAVVAAALAIAICFNQPNTGPLNEPGSVTAQEPYKQPPKQPTQENWANSTVALSSRFRLPRV